MKKQLTIKELKSLIKEEAQKLHRRTILENEKKALLKELRESDDGHKLSVLYDSSLSDEEKFDKIMNTQEYLTKDEYDFCVNYAGAEAVKPNMHYIGDYSSYGDYLNLNVYSEADKEAHDFARETGGYGDLEHYNKTGYINQDAMHDSIDDEEIENLRNQDDEFNQKYIRPHDSRNMNEDSEMMGDESGFDMEYLKNLNGAEEMKKYINSLENDEVRRFNSIYNVNDYKGGIRTIMFDIINNDIQQNKSMFDDFFK